jgi:hypothetical protein
MWLIWLILVPLAILVLFGLAVSAVLALTISLVVYGGPLLLIVAGVWLLMRALRPSQGRRHRRHRAHERRREPIRPPQPQPHPRTAPWHAAPPPRREVPIDVQVKAEQIRHKVGVLLGYADRFAPFSRDLYIVRQTAAEYLPRTIDAYLAIPGVDDPLVRATGRTALEELRGQLALLDARLDAITENLQQRDLDGLMANRRFLEERFGTLEDDEEIAAIPRFLDAAEGGPKTRTA